MFTLDFFPYPFIAGLLILLLLLARLHRRNRSPSFLLTFALFYGYLMTVAAIIFFPIMAPEDWPGGTPNGLWNLAHINLIPFNFGDLFSSNAWTIFTQLAGNILITTPCGFAAPLLTRMTPGRLFGLALSAGLALEGAQLAFELSGLVSGYGHSIDINDALLNATGVLAGYSLFRAVICLHRVVLHRQQ
jgi:glycopeptide antibiotics resistance protein